MNEFAPKHKEDFPGQSVYVLVGVSDQRGYGTEGKEGKGLDLLFVKCRGFGDLVLDGQIRSEIDDFLNFANTSSIK